MHREQRQRYCTKAASVEPANLVKKAVIKISQLNHRKQPAKLISKGNWAKGVNEGS